MTLHKSQFNVLSLPGLRAGWVDCWSVPNFLLIIDYTWHPIYPQKADEQLKQSCKMMTSYQFLFSGDLGAGS